MNTIINKIITLKLANHEVPGSNLLAAAVVPLGKEIYYHA